MNKIKRFFPTWTVGYWHGFNSLWFTIINIHFCSIVWKEKYNSNRIEYLPYVEITLFNYEVRITLGTDKVWQEYLDKKYIYENIN